MQRRCSRWSTTRRGTVARSRFRSGIKALRTHLAVEQGQRLFNGGDRLRYCTALLVRRWCFTRDLSRLVNWRSESMCDIRSDMKTNGNNEFDSQRSHLDNDVSEIERHWLNGPSQCRGSDSGESQFGFDFRSNRFCCPAEWKRQKQYIVRPAAYCGGKTTAN